MVGITAKIVAAEIRRQQQLSKDIVEGQTAISTGISLTKPSDNALAWVQVSDLARAQSQQAAWTTNVSYATNRAGVAEANLTDMNALLTRAQELVTSARNGSLNDTSRTAFVEELKSIKETIGGLVNQKDYQGTPVFDDGQNVLIPVSRGLNIAVVGTRQGVSEGIDVGGTPMSIGDMLDQAISAVQTGNDTDLATALNSVKAGQEHVTVELTRQGVRSDRLEIIGTRLADVDITLTERRQTLESTDLPTTISTVQAKLLQLNAAQSLYARINQKTLFDLIG